MKLAVYRWGIDLGWSHWQNYLGWYGGAPRFHIGHLQFSSSWDWRLRRPSMLRAYNGRFFVRYLEPVAHRWSSVQIGLAIWPVRFYFLWHPTCRGCNEAYCRDYERSTGRGFIARLP